MPPASPQPSQSHPPAPDLGSRLLVHWEPFWPSFLCNLADFVLLREPPPIELTSRPAAFWPDVFVHRPFPWKNFGQSGAVHAAMLLLIYFTGHLWFARQPRVADRFSHTTITYYDITESLPAFQSPAPKTPPKRPLKGEPEFARQEVISVPVGADNSTQTIINPPHPNVLRQEVPLPNMMAWTHLPAPPVESLSTRITLPRMEVTPVAPAPDTSQLRTRAQLDMTRAAAVEAQPALDALKPQRSDLSLATAPNVIPAQPKLELPMSQRAGGGLPAQTAEVVPPQPQLGSAGVGASPGAGQLIALSLRPAAPTGPIKVPDGSRSGVFAAGPTGRPGAPGTPNVPASGGASELGTGAGEGTAKTPGAGGIGASPAAGISVTGGAQPATGSVVASAPPPQPPRRETEAPRTLASASPMRFDRPPPIYQPPAERKVEDQVFGTRKSYSMTLNMANLTSSGGSWIIRFAELKESKDQGELSTPTVRMKVDPAYPPDLIKEQVEGVVTLYAVIHADGTVGEVRLLQGIHERLDANAIKALGRWTFAPAMKNGVPVDLEAVVSVPFKARRLTGF